MSLLYKPLMMQRAAFFDPLRRAHADVLPLNAEQQQYNWLNFIISNAAAMVQGQDCY